ncbi:hypothetical protein M5689_010961 [Euphorbia peplus]|nr:hypothetical protein M5689_010961 [Euphorbia peplus]
MVAEKPKDASEKEAQDAEVARLAEREKAAEAEKIARVVALADVKRKKKEAEDKLAAEREIAAKAKADARIAECAAEVGNVEFSGNVEATEEEEDSDDIPLSRLPRKKMSANRRSLNKKDFYIAPSTELDESTPEKEDLVDDEDMMNMSVEEDVVAPIIEELSEHSEPEADVVLKAAQ